MVAPRVPGAESTVETIVEVEALVDGGAEVVVAPVVDGVETVVGTVTNVGNTQPSIESHRSLPSDAAAIFVNVKTRKRHANSPTVMIVPHPSLFLPALNLAPMFMPFL